jgi:SAM-dependent methyltransferase
MQASGFRQFWHDLCLWWREQAREHGAADAGFLLLRNLWGFVRDSTPERRRARYGDMEYDWTHRVNTTSGTVGWRLRLLGLFHSPYQPTEPALFREMMMSLPIAFDTFTFVDLGSGKGRTLLMASEYPFRRIVGVELLRELHLVAQENLTQYKNTAPKCVVIEAICGNAADFLLPFEPLVLYLFNPLPESELKRVMINLERSLSEHPRAAYVLYHNPLLERVVNASKMLTRIGGTPQYSLYAFDGNGS